MGREVGPVLNENNPDVTADAASNGELSVNDLRSWLIRPSVFSSVAAAIGASPD
jgi:hypothetical protein